jgi:hypothetical protein
MVSAAEFWTTMTSGGDFIVRFVRPSPIAAGGWSFGILACPRGGTGGQKSPNPALGAYEGGAREQSARASLRGSSSNNYMGV